MVWPAYNGGLQVPPTIPTVEWYTSHWMTKACPLERISHEVSQLTKENLPWMEKFPWVRIAVSLFVLSSLNFRKLGGEGTILFIPNRAGINLVNAIVILLLCFKVHLVTLTLKNKLALSLLLNTAGLFLSGNSSFTSVLPFAIHVCEFLIYGACSIWQFF